MFPYINLFGAAIAVAPLILLLGLYFGSTLSEKAAPKYGIQPDQLYNLILIVLAAFVIGGRLSYAAQHFNAFAADPRGLISRNFGLFDPLGGAVIGALAGLIYIQRKGMAFWSVLDALTPMIAVMLVVVPLANLASGDGFGSPSSLPWAIELWGASRHPVQIYEAAAAGLILWAVWTGRLVKGKSPAGLQFLYFVAASAVARLIFEGLRGSSPLGLGNLRLYQVAAWGILAAALVGIDRLKSTSTSTE
jgi:prolipoprotein diacylglyceryltransferase